MSSNDSDNDNTQHRKETEAARELVAALAAVVPTVNDNNNDNDSNVNANATDNGNGSDNSENEANTSDVSANANANVSTDNDNEEPSKDPPRPSPSPSQMKTPPQSSSPFAKFLRNLQSSVPLQLPDLTNDDGVPIHFTPDIDRNSYHISYSSSPQICYAAYCGRYFGTTIIPLSDGRCGPNDGPPCPSCKRFLNDAKCKREVLKRLFPALRFMYLMGDEERGGRAQENLSDAENNIEEENQNKEDVYIINLLRKHHGHFGKCVNEIQDFNRQSGYSYDNIDQDEYDVDLILNNQFNLHEGQDDQEEEEEQDYNFFQIQPSIALSRQKPGFPYNKQLITEEYNALLSSVSEATGVSHKVLLHYALGERYYDTSRAIELIRDEERFHTSSILADIAEEDEESEENETQEQGQAQGGEGSDNGNAATANTMDGSEHTNASNTLDNTTSSLSTTTAATAATTAVATPKALSSIDNKINKILKDYEEKYDRIEKATEKQNHKRDTLLYKAIKCFYTNFIRDREQKDQGSSGGDGMDNQEEATTTDPTEITGENAPAEIDGSSNDSIANEGKLKDDNMKKMTSIYPFQKLTESHNVEDERQTSLTLPPVIVERGHCMVLATTVKEDSDGGNNLPFHCKTCSSEVPSKQGGLYYCDGCHLCEGCIQQPREFYDRKYNTFDGGKEEGHQDGRDSDRPAPEATTAVAKNKAAKKFEPYTILQCPVVSNGGHLHHHPLEHALDKRTHCICDICEFHNDSNSDNEDSYDGDRGRSNIGWFCAQCDFDVCHKCASIPAPCNYSRAENEIVDSRNIFRGDEEGTAIRAFIALFDDGYGLDDEDAGADGEEIDGGENESNTGSNDQRRQEFGNVPFDEDATKRRAAEHWEKYEAATNNDIVLGAGAITAAETPNPFPPPRRPNDTNNNSLQITNEHDGNLPNEAMDALFLLQQPSRDMEVRAAADITQAENILRRIAPQVRPRSSSSYETLLSCISAGRIGIAGTMLLSQAYAPHNVERPSNQEDSDNPNEKMVCFCGEVIDKETAPDGAVGCLGGHAMHASCASDLLLGGGKCPTCRQTLFFSRVAGSEIKAAAKFAKKEINRVRLEEEEKVRKELKELAEKGLPTTFQIGDIVLVPADKALCKKLQLEDPKSGWWHPDMVPACGLEGCVSEIIECDNKQISVRVTSRGRHQFQFIRRVDDFECTECSSNNIGMRRCVHCDQCEMCCRRSIQECSKQTHVWNWSPSLLTLLRRANGSSALVLLEDTEECKAEQHILRLRGELVAIKAAREAVKEKTRKVTKHSSLKMPGKMGRQLSERSNDAVMTMAKSGFSPADWQRARHLLLLARQWGYSEDANAKRAQLYGAVKEGNLDSVARIVRRYNAERTAEAARWTGALTDICEYIVEPGAVVDLRSLPTMNSARTGFSLKPQTTFCSESELLDKDGNWWIKVACEPYVEDDDDVDNNEDNGSSSASLEIKAPPPQGWLKVRPGGDGSASIVKRMKNSLRCFGCGDNLYPPISVQEKYEAPEIDKLKKGETLLVACTLEKVKVHSWNKKYVACLLLTGNEKSNNNGNKEGSNENDKNQSLIFYRACDLVKPKVLSKAGDDFDEVVKVDGRLRSRRELVLNFGGEEVARKCWNEARKKEIYIQQDFASCARGHLLHARCLQEALVTGSRCPAPGCMEQLFLPKVTREINDDDDTCCGGGGDNHEMEALRAASELTGHSALLAARVAEGVADNNITDEALSRNDLKMCPMCCAGPLFNQECSDMSAHHGQCSVRALGGRSASTCSPNGRDFRVSASELAAKMTQVSSTRTVADLLPRCETHNCLVMFNGCMACGHLFTVGVVIVRIFSLNVNLFLP